LFDATEARVTISFFFTLGSLFVTDRASSRRLDPFRLARPARPVMVHRDACAPMSASDHAARCAAAAHARTRGVSSSVLRDGC
jgi:hypothetical protein